MSSLLGRFGCCFALLLATAGCGRQHSDPLAPAPLTPAEAAPASPPPPQSLSELDALEHDLTVNEQRLAGYLAGRGSELRAEVSKDETARARDEREEGEPRKAAEATSAQAARPSAAKPKQRDDQPADSAGAAAPAARGPLPEAPEPGAGSACDLACRALSSMRRSAERICSIAGEGDARCARARARVEDAVGRVSRASCACHEDD